jgi:hypothetical protein
MVLGCACGAVAARGFVRNHLRQRVACDKLKRAFLKATR